MNHLPPGTWHPLLEEIRKKAKKDNVSQLVLDYGCIDDQLVSWLNCSKDLSYVAVAYTMYDSPQCLSVYYDVIILDGFLDNIKEADLEKTLKKVMLNLNTDTGALLIVLTPFFDKSPKNSSTITGILKEWGYNTNIRTVTDGRILIASRIEVENDGN